MITDEKVKLVRLLALPVVLARAALDVHAIVTATEAGSGTVLATTAMLSLLHLALLVVAVALTWSTAPSRLQIGLGLLAAIGTLTIPGVVGLLHELGRADLWMWLSLITFASLVVLGILALLALRDQAEMRLFREVPDVRGWVVVVGGVVATWASLVVKLVPGDEFLPSAAFAYRIELSPTISAGQINLLVIITSVLVIAAAVTSRPPALAVAIGTPLVVGFVGQIIADLLLLVAPDDQLELFGSTLEPGVGFVALLGATGLLILALSLPRRPEVNAPS